jgi:hypothetical protein
MLKNKIKIAKSGLQLLGNEKQQYCIENLIFDIVEVCVFNESKLWDKSKYRWTY